MANRQFAKVRKELKERVCLKGLEASGLYSGFMVLSDWAIIAAAITLASLTESVLVYLITVPIIGSRMMALGVLMHEASHGILFKKPAFNRWLAEVCLAWPIAQSLIGYQNIHRQHHQHLKEDGDTEKPLEQYPEFQFPMPQKAWYLTVTSDITGINFIKYRLKQALSWVKGFFTSTHSLSLNLYTLTRLSLTLGTVSALVISGLGWELLLFWIVPYCTWFQLLLRIHASSEHFAIPDHGGFRTRTLKVSRVEAFFFFPHHMNYHCEHHLYPQVPFRHLPALHSQLLKEVSFKSNAHLTYGVKGLFNELTDV